MEGSRIEAQDLKLVQVVFTLCIPLSGFTWDEHYHLTTNMKKGGGSHDSNGIGV